MDDLNTVSAFLRVVERGSMTSAATALHCSASSISKRIKQLERSLGVTLLIRSTHGYIRPTEAGQAYFDHVRNLMRELENARDVVRSVKDSLEGELRVHLTPGTGRLIIEPLIFKFMRLHPQLKIVVSIRPVHNDVLERGFDLSILSADPDADDANYASIDVHELAKANYVICAAPRYLAQHGTPARPEELEHHNCLVSVRQPSPHKWWFRRNGKKFSVQVAGTLEADNWPVLYDAAREGLGIVRMLQLGRRTDLGPDLVPIFQDEAICPNAILALMHKIQPLPRKMEAFLAFLKDELGKQARAEG